MRRGWSCVVCSTGSAVCCRCEHQHQHLLCCRDESATQCVTQAVGEQEEEEQEGETLGVRELETDEREGRREGERKGKERREVAMTAWLPGCC